MQIEYVSYNQVCVCIRYLLRVTQKDSRFIAGPSLEGFSFQKVAFVRSVKNVKKIWDSCFKFGYKTRTVEQTPIIFN